MAEPVQESKHSSLLILGVVLLLTLGVGMLPSSWFGIKQASLSRSPINFDSDTVEDLAADENSDGIVDWNEIITQTTGDDELARAITERTPDPETVAQLNDPNNITASLTKNFYLASAYMNKTGEVDSSTKGAITQELLKAAASKLTYTTYTISDLSINKNESTASLKSYGNSLGKLVQKAVSANLVDKDLEDYKVYIDTKNMAAFERLATKRDVAGNLASELAVISVPQSAVPFHLVLLNNVQAYHETLDNMLQASNDPVRASLAYNRYKEDASAMLLTAVDFTTYFKTKGITFTTKEAGYVFR